MNTEATETTLIPTYHKDDVYGVIFSNVDPPINNDPDFAGEYASTSYQVKYLTFKQLIDGRSDFYENQFVVVFSNEKDKVNVCVKGVPALIRCGLRYMQKLQNIEKLELKLHEMWFDDGEHTATCDQKFNDGLAEELNHFIRNIYTQRDILVKLVRKSKHYKKEEANVLEYQREVWFSRDYKFCDVPILPRQPWFLYDDEFIPFLLKERKELKQEIEELKNRLG